ncbi:MAG: hypothetical protein NC247_10535, partial [Ruminococcus flavefaciens]|nr:hypothetical protein [Ruminococcus flavefaciens]
DETSVQNHKLTTSEMEQKLIHNLSTLIGKVQPDAVIFLDQLDYENYGVITTGMRRYIEKIHSEFPAVLTYVDSRQFIGDVAHTAIRKCNNFEFARAYSTDASNMSDLCEQLTNRSDTPLIVTLGADGTLISKHGQSPLFRLLALMIQLIQEVQAMHSQQAMLLPEFAALVNTSLY